MDLKPFSNEDSGKVFTAFFERGDKYLAAWGRVRKVDERGILMPAFEPGSFGLHSFIQEKGKILVRLAGRAGMEVFDCNHFSLHTAEVSARYWQKSAQNFVPVMNVICVGLGFDHPPPIILNTDVLLFRGKEVSRPVRFHGLAFYENGRAWLLPGLNVECFGFLLKELVRIPGTEYGEREFLFVPVETDAKPFNITVVTL